MEFVQQPRPKTNQRKNEWGAKTWVRGLEWSWCGDVTK
jgi:hypothetical protein